MDTHSFAGFDGVTTDGDSKSPRLSSYIAFSRLVRDVSDVPVCYQSADPTSNIDSDIVPTDGGFVRIDGAYNIRDMIATGSSLIIIASNGVWRLVGGSDFGFAADNYRVDRISRQGCNSPKSIVDINGAILFWGDDGIYKVGVNNLGDWSVDNITQDKITKLYNLIPLKAKALASGLYDSYERKVRWIYNNTISDISEVKELIYDIDLAAFYPNTINSISNSLPKVVDIANSNPYVEGRDSVGVVVNDDPVQVNGVNVEVEQDNDTQTTQETVYIAVDDTTTVVKYTISKYQNRDFIDWLSKDDTGIDAPAYVVTSAYNTGDNQHRKKLNRLVVHSDRTESNMVTNASGQIEPKYQSSCLVQAQWNWSGSANSNRWSNPRQFYRPRRLYLPVDINDAYDTGFNTVVTKDVIRGHGKTLSLKFSTEPLKDMKIYGWSMLWGISENVGS